MKAPDKFLSLLMIALIAVTGTGCSDDSNNDEAIIYNIVKLASQDSNGAVFTFSKPLAENMVTLTSSPVIDTEIVKPGERLLLAYVPLSGESYASGPVSVKGYRPINNAEMTDGTKDDLVEWDKDAVYLLSAWQSECYLNIYARLPYDTQPRRMDLVRDTESDASWPDIYLVHQLKEEIETFDRAYYISFDISQLTDDQNIEGFTLHLNDSNLELKSIDFPLAENNR